MKASRYCHESRMRGASELWVHADAMDSGTEVADGSSSATAEIAICTQLHSHPLQCEVPGDEGLAWGRCVLQGFPPSICIRILLSLITISCTHLIMSSYISSGHLHGFGGRTPAIQTPSSSCSQGDYCTSRRCEIPEWRDRRRGEDQTSTLPTSSLQVPCNRLITRFVSLFHPPNVRLKIEDSRVECLGGKPAGTIR